MQADQFILCCVLCTSAVISLNCSVLHYIIPPAGITSKEKSNKKCAGIHPGDIDLVLLAPFVTRMSTLLAFGDQPELLLGRSAFTYDRKRVQMI